MTVIEETMRGGTARRPARTARPASAAMRKDKAAKLPWPVLIYILGIVLPVGFDAGPLALSIVRLFLLIVTIPLMIQLLMGRFGKVYLIDILFIVHVLWMMVSFSITTPDRMVEQVGSVGMEFLGGYAIGRAFIRTPEAFVKLCQLLVVIVLLMLPLALYEAQTGRSPILEIIEGLPTVYSSSSINWMEGRLGFERVQTVWDHPIHHGVFGSMVFALAFVGLKGTSSPFWRLLSGSLIALFGFLALSSAAITALVVQLGLIIWATVLARFKGRWWLLVGLFALAYVVIDLLSNRTPLRVFLSYATLSPGTGYTRIYLFEWGTYNIARNPWFGVGMNDWIRPSWLTGSMDNFWVATGLRYGMPGLLLLAAGYFLALFRIMWRDFSRTPLLANLRLAWVFTFVGLTFTVCTVHLWANIYSFTFFLFGAGIWLVGYKAPEAEAPPQGAGRRLRPIERAAPKEPETAAQPRPASPYTRFPVRQRPPG